MKGTLVIVPCGRAKVWDRNPGRGPTPARDAYTGAPFRVNRAYAERFGDAWLVLSARYGLVRHDFAIPGPYNVSFKDHRTGPIALTEIRRQVEANGWGAFDTVIGLGGREYREVLERTFAGTLCRLVFPFAGLRLGEAMAATNQAVRRGDPVPRSA
jgi:hypothetical protein